MHGPGPWPGPRGRGPGGFGGPMRGPGMPPPPPPPPHFRHHPPMGGWGYRRPYRGGCLGMMITCLSVFVGIIALVALLIGAII